MWEYGKIYGLFDPETDELRYIGQTISSLDRRLWHHTAPSVVNNPLQSCHRTNWIKSLMRLGLKPRIRTLAIAQSKEELDRLERKKIAEARTSGVRLTNTDSGGNSHPPEYYSRLAASKKGIPRSAEVKAKISAAKIGTPSPKRGIPMSEEQKAKVSASRTGKLLESSHHQYRDDISTDHILRRLREGATKVQVAEELGVAPTFIHRRLKQAKRHGQEAPPRGKHVPMDRVLELRAQGLTLRELAERFSVSQAYMCRALKESV